MRLSRRARFAALQAQGKLNGAGRLFAPAQIARMLTPANNRIGRQARASRAAKAAVRASHPTQ
jgi:hypothetical protein